MSVSGRERKKECYLAHLLLNVTVRGLNTDVSDHLHILLLSDLSSHLTPSLFFCLCPSNLKLSVIAKGLGSDKTHKDPPSKDYCMHTVSKNVQ